MFKDVILNFKNNYVNNIKNKKEKQILLTNLGNTYLELEKNQKGVVEMLR